MEIPAMCDDQSVVRGMYWDYPVTYKPDAEVPVDHTMSTSMTTGLQKCSLV